MDTLQTEWLILGYGNTLRSDDAVGPLAADAIAALGLTGVSVLSCAQLTPELADPIARARRVVFVDAALDAPRSVQLRPLEPAGTSQLMAHAADPRTMLALARDVFGRAPEAWWLTIPVTNLGIGETLTEFAREGLTAAVREIQRLTGTRLDRGPKERIGGQANGK
jgi:hydrogenase maturation protease